MIARAVRLAQATSSTASIVLLVGFNLVPLFGVVFLGWNIATILVLYWIENGIVGLLNVPKMLLARGTDLPRPMTGAAVGIATGTRLTGLAAGSRGLMVVFFLIHYGLFWFVHGVFVFALPTFASFGRVFEALPLPDGSMQLVPASSTATDVSAVLFGAVGLAIARGASFALNYVGRREYLRVSPGQQMFAPYGRMLVLHVTIIFGAFLSILLGSPVGAIVVLVLVKTGIDLALHMREHDRLDRIASSSA